MKKCLVLSLPSDESEDYRYDFETIAAMVQEYDPTIDVHLLFEDAIPEALIETCSNSPTLIVATLKRDHSVLPGYLMACKALVKTEQYIRYAAEGIPFPPTAIFRWGMKLDPAQFSDFVVMKPLNPTRTSHGAVRLLPTGIIPELRPKHFPVDHPIRSEPIILQRFIDTGRYPSVTRVLMLFDTPLYSMDIRLKESRPPLSSTRQDLFRAIVATNGGPRDRVLNADPDVLQLAVRAIKALSEIPLQALDIIRERKTGKLFLLESNPGGNTWHFSSNFAEQMRQEMGDGREKLLKQFDAIDAATKALVKATQTFARLDPQLTRV